MNIESEFSGRVVSESTELCMTRGGRIVFAFLASACIAFDVLLFTDTLVSIAAAIFLFFSVGPSIKRETTKDGTKTYYTWWKGEKWMP